jgi:hypothetical protein
MEPMPQLVALLAVLATIQVLERRCAHAHNLMVKASKYLMIQSV